MPTRSRFSQWWLPLAAVAIATAVSAVPAEAQFISTRSGRTDPLPYKQILSIDPVRLIGFGSFAADYERRVTQSGTVGVSVATYSPDDDSYLAIEGKGRYYVTGRAFDGLSVVASSGLMRMVEDSTDVKEYAFGIGFGADYQMLIGAEERVALTVGGGATRLFLLEDPTPFKRVLLTWRLSAGWGF